MASLPIYHVASYFSSTGFVATVILNPFLIFLTILHTKKIDKTYKKLMIVFSLVCLIFSFIEMLVHPFYHSYNGGMISFNMVRWEGLSREWVTVMVGSYSGVYASIVSFFPVLFVYRYWTMLSSPLLRTFNGWKVWFLVLYTAFFGSLCGSIALYLGDIDKYSQDYLRAVMKEHYDLDINKTSGFVIIAYDQHGKLRWTSFFFSFCIISLMGSQFAIVGYCGIQIHLKMNEMLKNVSESHRRLQKQFFKSLVLQISSPTLTFYIPAVAIMIVPFLDIQWSIPSGLIVCSFSIYPPIDSLILMVVVSDYKKAIRNIFKKPVSPQEFSRSATNESRFSKIKSSLCC